MLGWRWSLRLLGFISVIILARLLTPEDYGVVAMATILTGLLGEITDFGVMQALINRTSLDNEHLNTGWTIQLIQRAVVSILLVPVAHLGGIYFNDIRIIPVIYALAAASFISGFGNIGIVYFQRELNFKKDFIYGVSQKVVSFVVTVAAGFILRNYWALVVGIIAERMTALTMSYVMHPFRPRISLARFSQLWGFSQWMLVSTSVRYCRDKADQFFVGGALGSIQMGQYTVGFRLATLPTSEVIVPIGRALFPNYSKIAHDQILLKDSFLKSISAMALLIPVVGIGLACVAQDAVPVILGEKWINITPIVQLLSLMGVVGGLMYLARPLLMALGDMKTVANFELLHAIIVVPAAFLAAHYGTVVTVALSRLVSNIIMLPIIYSVTMRRVGIGLNEILSCFWRPSLSISVMALILSYTDLTWIDSRVIKLLFEILLGGGAYLIMVLVLSMAFGYKDTVERELLRRLLRRHS